jgi:hypothetical protein
MFGHLPLHGIQFVLHSVGHTGMCSVMQQNNAVIDFSLTFVLDLGMLLLKCGTVMIYNVCVVV